MRTSLLILLWFVSGTAFSQDVQLRAKVEQDTFQLGSWIDVHVEGKQLATLDSIAPVVKDSIGPFEVLAIKRESADLRWLIRVTSIDSGKMFLPPIEFGYKMKGDTTTRKSFTNSLLITLAGFSVNPQGEIKDIKPPMDAPWLFEDFLPYIIALVVIGALVGGYFYYRHRIKLKKDILADVKVFIPPHREALAALRMLEEKKLWQQGLVKEYYSDVTEIIRRFFERRWNIIALEMTTEEILMQMKPIPEALMVWKEMESFFLNADLVKFAKYQPAPAEHDQEMRSAYEIVRAMVPKTSVESGVPNEEVTADVR